MDGNMKYHPFKNSTDKESKVIDRGALRTDNDSDPRLVIRGESIPIEAYK